MTAGSNLNIDKIHVFLHTYASCSELQCSTYTYREFFEHILRKELDNKDDEQFQPVENAKSPVFLDTMINHS